MHIGEDLRQLRLITSFLDHPVVVNSAIHPSHHNFCLSVWWTIFPDSLLWHPVILGTGLSGCPLELPWLLNTGIFHSLKQMQPQDWNLFGDHCYFPSSSERPQILMTWCLGPNTLWLVTFLLMSPGWLGHTDNIQTRPLTKKNNNFRITQLWNPSGSINLQLIILLGVTAGAYLHIFRRRRGPPR